MSISRLGVGAGQLLASITVITYYSSLVALTVYYFCASFASVLPWSRCRTEWTESCVDSMSTANTTYLDEMASNNTKVASSSELYFL